MSTLVIGKIPSYNANLKPLKGVDYENRLLNNLTVTEFSPIGYSINLADFQSIYRIGPTLSSTASNDSVLGKIGNTISLYTALSQWTEMQRLSGIEKPCNSFKIISTNDSTINETLSNQYKNNVLDDVGSWAGSGIGGLIGSNVLTSAKDLIASSFQTVGPSLDTGMALNVLGSLQNLATSYGASSQYAGVLLGKMIGIQAAFPKIWSTSDYNNTSSFTIKLISPDGNPVNVNNFVLKPLRTLILAASPITFDGISYGYPPLWKVYAKGMVSMKLAAVTAITISRGGQDTLFNRYNQPTNIDVRITVEPVIQGFATPLRDGISDTPDSNGGVQMIVQNPSSIIDPMTYNNKTSDYDDIMLRPLILN